jgi:hypothetical protein
MYIIYSMKERMKNERAVAVKNGIQKCKGDSKGSKKELIMVLGQQESCIGGVSEKGMQLRK